MFLWTCLRCLFLESVFFLKVVISYEWLSTFWQPTFTYYKVNNPLQTHFFFNLKALWKVSVLVNRACGLSAKVVGLWFNCSCKYLTTWDEGGDVCGIVLSVPPNTEWIEQSYPKFEIICSKRRNHLLMENMENYV